MLSPIRNVVFALLLLFIRAGTLHAQTTTTGAATGVTDISALVSGNFVPGNDEWYDISFQVGTTTNYGTEYGANPDFIEDEQPHAVTALLSGLQPNTTYHYRMMAMSTSIVYTYGQDMTFTTGPASTPPSITGDVQVQANGYSTGYAQVQSVQAGGAPATVVFEYGLTTDYGSSAHYPFTLALGDWDTDVYAFIGGLAPSTTYHVRCKATSALGTAVSPDATFTTLPAPVLVTGNATNITDLSARLNGTLTANGPGLEVLMEYGTDTTYGHTLSIWDDPNKVFPEAVSLTATDLLPNTVYHFRLGVDSESDGYLYGNDMVFSTAAPATPPAVSGTVSVSSIGSASASVSGTAVFSGSSPATVTYEYGTTTAYGSITQVSQAVATNTTAYPQGTLTGLTSGTAYHVRCTATNGQGSSSSGDSTFTTLAAPVVVTGAASSVTDLTAVLNGTVNAQGTPVQVEFEYGTDTSYGSTTWVSMASLADASTHAETGSPPGLQPLTTYHYRLRAYDANKVYYYGADATFTTTAAATPPTVGNVQIQSLGTTAVSLVCQLFTGSSPASAVFDYGTTTAYGSTATVFGPLGPNYYPAGQVTLTGLSLLTTYHVRCRITNSEGGATSADATFTTLGVPVVTTDPVTNFTDLSATLNGSINPNGPSTTATLSFELGLTTNYGTTMGAYPGSVLSSSLTTFSGPALGLLPGTTYHYRAKVYYAFTNGTFYGPDVAFTTGAPGTPPTLGSVSASGVDATTAFLGVSTVTAGSSDVAVTWDFGTSTAYVSTVASVPGTIRVSTSATTSVILHGLTPGTTYHYRCTATNAQGSASSADATFTTALVPVLTTSPVYTATDLTANLSGSVTFNGNIFTTFDFEWGTDTTYGTQVQVFGIGNSTSMTLTATATGLLPNTTYHYRVRGFSYLAGMWYYGQDQTLTTGPPNTPPTIVTGASTAVNTTTMKLNISSLQTGSSATTVSYEYGLDTTYGTTIVYPTTLPLSQTYSIFNNTLPVTVTGLTPNTTYHFRAKAVNNEGASTGLDGTFVTPAVPLITTTAATNVGTVSAQLNGTYTALGVTSYTAVFDYGPTTDYGSTIPATVPFAVVIGGGGGGLINLGGTTGIGLTKTGTGNLTLTGTTTTYTGTIGTTGGIVVLNNNGLGTIGLTGATLTGTTGVINVANVSGGFSTGSGSVIDLLDWANLTGETFATSISGTGTTTSNSGTTTTLQLPVLGGGVTYNPIAADGGIVVIGPGGPGGGIIINPNPNLPLDVSAPLTSLTPSTTYHFRLKLTDTSGNTYYGDDMTFTTIGPTALAQNWRQEFFSSPDNNGPAADMANPSGDGIPNLVKYALGLDPTASSVGSIPQPVLKDYNGLTYLDYTFQRDSSMTDLTYAVQAADSPAGPWTTVASSVGGAPTTGPGFVTENIGYGIGGAVLLGAPTPVTLYTVEVRDVVSTADAPRRFLRLQITRP